MRPCRAGSLALLLGVAASRPAWAAEVVERFADGTPKAAYVVDDEGRKEGRYTEFFEGGSVAIEATYKRDRLDGPYATFFPSGRLRLRTTYAAGLLDGRYEAFTEDGAPLRTARYVAGRLHGKVEVFRGKTVVTTQIWKEGTLVTWNGVPAFPRDRATLERTLASIEAGQLTIKSPGKPRPRSANPEKSSGEPPGLAPAPEVLAADRVRALRRLQAYRYLCEVAYEDLLLDDDLNAAAQAAAEICARLGHLSHAPSNPGLPDDAYRLAARGARGCNLHQLEGATASVDGFMDDSDPMNVATLGHRRWCLSPRMRMTGFGVARSADGHPFTAMWVKDASRGSVPDYVALCYPARGWNPAAMFSDHHAWSVAWNPARFPHVSAATLHVEVWRLDADFVPAAAPLPLEAVSVVADRVGASPCLIFRPIGVDLADGAAYAVEVTGLADGAKAERLGEGMLRYVVQFYGSVASPNEAPPADAGGK